MGKHSKLRDKILAGSSDNNIEFQGLRQLLHRLDFTERIRGDHHIFVRNGINEIVNLQPIGSKAKSYQIKQIREILVEYGLGDADVD